MDNKDLLILKIIQEKPNTSLTELKEIIQVRSVATVFNRVNLLEKRGYLEGPPSPKQARSRKITLRGENLLKSNNMG